MDLKSLLLSQDEKTVRILRRVLGDLEIGIEHFSTSEDAIRRLTRQRFEAIIVDCSDLEHSNNVLLATKSAPVNKRALTIVLVEASVGLKGGFEIGAHFVLHKPLAVERAKASFRAVRALMKSERRLQMRVPVQIPVLCVGASRYQAKTLDLCEGGMAVQFSGRAAKESVLRFSLDLPGVDAKIEVWGELAWEGEGARAGVRFKDVSDEQRLSLRNWLSRQLPEGEPDDPPVPCRLAQLSPGACYLTTTTPFPKSTRVVLSFRTTDPHLRASGVVRLSHGERGMGIEFLKANSEQQGQIRAMVAALRAAGDSAELHVEPDGLDAASEEQPAGKSQSSGKKDTLLDLFSKQSQVPAEAFFQQLEQQTVQESR